ncbi:MAG: response regulator transcription factor [Ectothiorhodospiraceae bacterium]|jgi:DNA-binding response OmpR family regulator|nr:response regulator transcription factor [Ectothiorhodospiraceae bacterium]
MNAHTRTRPECKRLLLVDGDETLRAVVSHFLSIHDFEVDELASADAFITAALSLRVDGALLELDLPDEDGLVLLGRLRQWSDIPVMVISNRRDDESRVRAFELGADDYLTKPFNPQEMVLRVQRMIDGRAMHGEHTTPPLRIGSLLLDARRREARKSTGEPLKLTASEFELLATLADASGGVVSRTRLVQSVARIVDGGSPESVTVLIHRLRQKLATATGESPDEVIRTVPRFGYRLGLEVEST